MRDLWVDIAVAFLREGLVSGEERAENTMVGRDIGDVPKETFKSPVDGAQDQKVVEEGTQENSLERDLQLRLSSPADVVD